MLVFCPSLVRSLVDPFLSLSVLSLVPWVAWRVFGGRVGSLSLRPIVYSARGRGRVYRGIQEVLVLVGLGIPRARRTKYTHYLPRALVH